MTNWIQDYEFGRGQDYLRMGRITREAILPKIQG